MLSCGKTVSAVPKTELKWARSNREVKEENIPLPASLCSLMILKEEPQNRRSIRTVINIKLSE